MPLGWIGNALIIFGAWQIGYRRRWGFLVAMFGGLSWMAEGIRIGKTDLIFIEVVMCLVALRNFIKWKKCHA